MSIPGNLRMTAVMADAEHVADVVKMIPVIKDEHALMLIGAWRRDLYRFPFLVMAGPMYRRGGGIVGGLAAQWEQALGLQRFALERLDELAQPAGFTSMWCLLLTDERRDRVDALIAQWQPVEGHA
jgi:hypothetical protein